MQGVGPIVCVHTGPQGELWVSDSQTRAQPTGVGADDFHQVKSLYAAGRVYVACEACNARLLAELLEQQVIGIAPGKVRLLPPPRTNSVRPEHVLTMVWHGAITPGTVTRRFTPRPADAVAYRMTDRLMTATAWEATGDLPRHPAYPALSFLGLAREPDAAAELLGMIMDPRRFRHPTRPQRVSRLMRYLGATPNNVRAILGRPACKIDPNLGRAQTLVRMVWDPDRPTLQDQPSHFLGRMTLQDDEFERGILRTARWMLRLIWYCWVQQADPTSEIFLPEMFFDRREAKAFHAHQQLQS